ncbi:restriction endonuclease subunit S [Streptomyces qaidamensis]|uniref:restriction endonuclease subunit S n=1 Tax=Streptomyces qaidamensis TaxID=1783515 RepID=UPI0009A09814|nr:restriction endonuclease subunit S [Streptomyces qaidamensis]
MSERELPTGWAYARLADVLSEPLLNGRSVKTAANGFPFLRLTAITREGVDLSEQKNGAWTQAQAMSFLVSDGDFLVCRTNGSLKLVGRGALARNVDSPVAFPSNMIRVRPHPEVMTPEYLANIWESPLVRSQIEEYARTTAHRAYTISHDILADIRIPLPPIAEQRRIVKVLESHLTRLSAGQFRLQRSISLAHKLRSAVRDTAISGGTPFTATSSHWRWGNLSDVIARIETGRFLPCERRPAGENEWGVIKASAMTRGIFDNDEHKAVQADTNIDPQDEIKQNDILVSRANTAAHVGAAVLVGSCRPRLLLSDKSLRLVPKDGIEKTWLIQILSSPHVRRVISSMATGTLESMRNITQQSLMSIQIPIPSHEEQARIGESIKSDLERIDQLTGTLEPLRLQSEYLRQSLLTRAVEGQLVLQDPADEPASAQLTRIRAEGEAKGRRRQTTRRRPRRSDLSSPSSLARAAIQLEFEL